MLLNCPDRPTEESNDSSESESDNLIEEEKV